MISLQLRAKAKAKKKSRRKRERVELLSTDEKESVQREKMARRAVPIGLVDSSTATTRISQSESESEEQCLAKLKPIPLEDARIDSRFRRRREAIERQYSRAQSICAQGDFEEPSEQSEVYEQLASRDSSVSSSKHNIDSFALDLAACADDDDIDYEHVGIDDFAARSLLGMGWTPGTAIGVTNKGLLKPIEFVANLGRTGLGARPEQRRNGTGSDEPNAKRRRFVPKPGQRVAGNAVLPRDADGRQRHWKTIDEELVERVPSVGSRVHIVGGRHRGVSARVVSIADDQLAALVEFDSSARASVDIDHFGHASSSTATAPAANAACSSSSWSMFVNARVRVTSKLRTLHYFRVARIVDVPLEVHCDLLIGAGDHVSMVPRTDIEPLPPTLSSPKCIVICGQLRASLATLIELRPQSDNNASPVAVIQLNKDDSIHSLELDSLASISIQ
jgi:Fe2+ transport system protein FeoA